MKKCENCGKVLETYCGYYSEYSSLWFCSKECIHSGDEAFWTTYDTQESNYTEERQTSLMDSIAKSLRERSVSAKKLGIDKREFDKIIQKFSN